MASASAVCLVGSWRLGYPELAVLGVAGALALALSALWLIPTTDLEATREIAPPKAERGGEAIGLLRVSNTGTRRSRRYRAVDQVGDGEATLEVPSLPPGVRRTITYSVPTARRGEVAVGPLRLVRTDPLGLYERRQRVGEDTSLLVRPRVLASAPAASGRTASLDGPDSETSPSGTVTFHSLREYVFGDDMRHIHWRTSARLGTLMVRRLVDAGEPRTTVVLDTGATSYQDPEMFELAVDAAASVAVSAARLGFPVAVSTGERRRLAVRGGGADAETLLDWLALVVADDVGGEVGETLRGLGRDAGHESRGALVVVTGALGGDGFERIVATARGFDRTTVLRVGRNLPPAPVSPAVRILDIDAAETFAAAWRHEVRA